MVDLWIVEQMCGDPHARRELLWLRAKEKEDEETVRDLERIDPGVVERLVAAGFDIAERESEPSSVRRERYGRLWDACWRYHARELLRQPRAPAAGALR